MSKNIYYYGEIVARIAGKLYRFPNHEQWPSIIQDSNLSADDLICELSADAGRIFDMIEDISGEMSIDWAGALDHYSQSLHSFLSNERMPTQADMIYMAAKSMNISRPGCS